MARKVCILAVLLAGAACDDGFGPRTWDPTPDTTVLYSVSRPELIGRPSAFDFVQMRRLPVEQLGVTGDWDVVLAEQNGAFVFVPSGNFPGIISRAGVGETNSPSLDALTRAPGDTASYSRQPVTLRTGVIYVVRSRTAGCLGFGTGVYYGKFEIVSIDAAAGTVRMAATRNPYCNDRALVPEQDDD